MLEHGSLLAMRGETQYFWKHQLPTMKKSKLPRVNLTFRTIMEPHD
ncbi:MAG: alpha-ketoglutarate-dependent dioxygenase AlkB, partial [Crocinitomicaceae bacterium]|nr:alpha-ketoglutarate-dependent dioxygenase AlkB [Crocinitomicaceae bacterium]